MLYEGQDIATFCMPGGGGVIVRNIGRVTVTLYYVDTCASGIHSTWGDDMRPKYPKRVSFDPILGSST